MTLRDFETCVEEAKKRTRATLGHAFLGSRCANCGRSEKSEVRCVHESKTLVMRLTEVLMENGTIRPVDN